MRFALFFTALAALAQQRPYLQAPAGDAYAVHDPNGTTILPNGRFLRPAGTHTPLARFPHGMAMSRDGALLFIPSDGLGQLVSNWQTKPTITEIAPPKPANNRRIHLNAGGADFSPDGSLLYWSSGERGSIFVYDTRTAKLQTEISLNADKFNDSYAVDVKLSPDGRHLYCADVTNFRLAVIDTAQRRPVGSVPVGRYPYALTIAGANVLVANIGLFEYSAIPAPNDPKFDKRGLTRPAFGYPSKEAREGVEFEGRKVPASATTTPPKPSPSTPSTSLTPPPPASPPAGKPASSSTPPPITAKPSAAPRPTSSPPAITPSTSPTATTTSSNASTSPSPNPPSAPASFPPRSSPASAASAPPA